MRDLKSEEWEHVYGGSNYGNSGNAPGDRDRDNDSDDDSDDDSDGSASRTGGS